MRENVKKEGRSFFPIQIFAKTGTHGKITLTLA